MNVSAPTVLNISDLRTLAKKRMPKVVFDYLDGGAETERTLRENVSAFEEVTLRPRGAVENATVDLRTTVLGHDLSVPFILAPVGSTRLFFPKGEKHAAHAAGELGTLYTLSTLSGTPLEEVRSGSKGPLWYQLYLIGGREVARAAIQRAKEAGYSALMVTIDTPVSGMRERDFRDGIKALVSGNPFRMLPWMGQFMLRPGWLMRFFGDGGMMRFPNVVLPDGPMKYAEVSVALSQSVVTWADLTWIREVWNGPIILKGLLTGEDAKRAADEGISAVVVSNHGGRQLDGVSATLKVLPEVVAAAGDRLTVLVDGGIRRGSDVVKALCLGAKAVLVGRAYAYGLGAGGEPGVVRALEILRDDLDRTLKLLGCPSVKALDRSYVDAPAGWFRPR